MGTTYFKKSSATIATCLSLVLVLSPLTAFSAKKVTAGAACVSLNKKITFQNKIYTCIKSGKKMIWSKGVDVRKEVLSPTPSPTPIQSSTPTPTPTAAPTPTATPMATPTPTPEIVLPKEFTPCTQIGQKVFGNGGYMKCFWSGGANSDEISKQIFWRFFDTPKISTSQSNNYPVTPVEGQTCWTSGDTYDVSGGILECRWIHGKKLQWIKINNIKRTFTNAVSPVPIDICKLQQSATKVVRTGRDAGSGMIGFPHINSDKNGMNAKGNNEILILPVDFPDFPGEGSPKAQVEYDAKWLKDWYNYFSNGQAIFNVTTKDTWFRMPKPRSAYPTDGKIVDGLSADSNSGQGRQAQAFIDEITKEFDLRKFSTVFLFYPEGEYTKGDLIVRNHKFKIKEGEKALNFFSWGKNLEASQVRKWVWYVHENLHDFNIIGHAPGNGWPFGIMINDGGISTAINSWEQFLLDWLPSNQIYCDDLNTLKTNTISLSPMEREDRQTKMAIIRISPTKAVVVVSHGIDKWSSFNYGDRSFPPGFYSVMTYVVDLDKQFAPPNNPDGTSLSNQYSAWATWARVEGGKSTQYPYYPVAFGEDMYSAVAVLGDSFVIEGVRIKFVGTGDYETIEISKA